MEHNIGDLAVGSSGAIFRLKRDGLRLVWECVEVGGSNNIGQCIDESAFGLDEMKTLKLRNPSSIIKDGWHGVQRNGMKCYFLPSIDFILIGSVNYSLSIMYSQNLTRGEHLESNDIMKLYDNEGDLKWERKEFKRSETEIKLEEAILAYNDLGEKIEALRKEMANNG